jgi:hypothetical protein
LLIVLLSYTPKCTKRVLSTLFVFSYLNMSMNFTDLRDL